MMKPDWSTLRYAGFLATLEEPLWNPPASESLHGYRLLIVPSFDDPSMIRIVEENSVWRVVGKKKDTRDDQRPLAVTTRDLTKNEAKRLTRRIRNAGFWELPMFAPCNGTRDGAEFVIEGVEAGRYRAIESRGRTAGRPDPLHLPALRAD